jgi:exopolysaccharide biosynthesis polyprenyl glycosylphosphotransferase
MEAFAHPFGGEDATMLRIQKRAISKKRISLILVDLLVLQLGFLLAALIRFGFANTPHYLSERWLSFYLIIPVFLIVFYVVDLYDIKKDYRRLAESLQVAAGTVVSILISVFLSYLLFYGNLSFTLGRGVLSLYALLVFLGILGWRWLYSLLGVRGVFARKVIVVGKAGQMAELEPLLQEIHSDMDLSFGGFIGLPLEASPSSPPLPNGSDLGTTEQLLEIAAREDPDVLVLALPSEGFRPLIRDLIWCNQKGIQIRDVISFSEEYFKRIPLEFIDDLWFLISYINIPKIHTHRIKRLMDLSISLFALILGLPIALLLAILIKIESRGSPFFIQERIGKDGKPFRLVKFRSMVQDAEVQTGPIWAAVDDPRITRIGKFIRRWRLDEIPQLLNVLRGEMSLVGPRPERREFVEELKSKVPYFMERLSVKPGITGWAQAESSYASSVEESQRKLEYDLYYIKNISFLLDTLILLKTLKVILLGKGR